LIFNLQKLEMPSRKKKGRPLMWLTAAALLLLSSASRRSVYYRYPLSGIRMLSDESAAKEHQIFDDQIQSQEEIKQQPWFLYLLECVDGSYYAGISNDVEKRVAKHNNGSGAKYTRGRLPVKLLNFKEFENRSLASKAEWEIKQLPRSKKVGYFL